MTEWDEKIESSLSILQQHVQNLKHVNTLKFYNIEQYGRRLCLRIDGVPSKKECKTDKVLETVKEKIKMVGIDIPESVLDRAHRISKAYIDRISGKKTQSTIVRFTTFKHRTLFF